MVDHRSVTGTAIAGAFLVFAPASAQRAGHGDSTLAGCYVFTWSGGKTRQPLFPDTVVLTLSPAQQKMDGYVARVDTAWVRRTWISQYSWKPVARDSLFIAQTHGTEVVALRLVRAATGYRGIATAFINVGDSLRPFPTWRVEARRAACENSI